MCRQDLIWESLLGCVEPLPAEALMEILSERVSGEQECITFQALPSIAPPTTLPQTIDSEAAIDREQDIDA